jgi:hypothetical protein
MPRQSGPSNSFTPEDIARLRRIIEIHRGKSIKWDRYIGEFSHPLGSVKVMASKLRTRMDKERRRDVNRAVRALRDLAPPAPRIVRSSNVEEKPLPRAIGIEAHRTNTSTQSLQFAAEMLVRVGSQGITAGLLGDPLPGRSALDKKRAGIADNSHHDRRKEQQFAETSAQIWRLKWRRQRDIDAMAAANETTPT